MTALQPLFCALGGNLTSPERSGTCSSMAEPHHLLQVDEPEVWSELGHAQLEAGAVDDAIGSYLKSGDTSRYSDVILRSRDAGAHKVLVDYLLMVRKKVKDPKVRPFPCSWTVLWLCS